MSNQNTLTALQGGTRAGQVATLTNIGTTETAFSVLPNPVTGLQGGVATLTLPDSDQYVAGRTIKVRVGGTITTNATTNVSVKLYQGNDSNLSNDHILVAPTAVNANTQTTQFLIKADLQYDATSQTIHGTATAVINGTIQSPNPFTSNVVASIASSSSLQFVASGVFGVSNAANSISITEMAIDAE